MYEIFEKYFSFFEFSPLRLSSLLDMLPAGQVFVEMRREFGVGVEFFELRYPVDIPFLERYLNIDAQSLK